MLKSAYVRSNEYISKIWLWLWGVGDPGTGKSHDIYQVPILLLQFVMYIQNTASKIKSVVCVLFIHERM